MISQLSVAIFISFASIFLSNFSDLISIEIIKLAMEKLKFSNRCVYRDTTGHIYRLNKVSNIKSSAEYYNCWLKGCGTKIKIVDGQTKIYGSDHSHPTELALEEYKHILFDKYLNELLPSIDICALSSAQIYENVLQKVPNRKFDEAHKKKKMKFINTNRCFAKKYKPSVLNKIGVNENEDQSNETPANNPSKSKIGKFFLQNEVYCND